MKSKLLVARILWFVALPADVLLVALSTLALVVLSLFVDVYDHHHLLFLAPFPFEEDVTDTPLTWLDIEEFDECYATLYGTADESDTVNVAGLDIAITIETAINGYRVWSLEQPNIQGWGASVTAAKYDFQLAYKRWLNDMRHPVKRLVAACEEPPLNEAL